MVFAMAAHEVNWVDAGPIGTNEGLQELANRYAHYQKEFDASRIHHGEPPDERGRMRMAVEQTLYESTGTYLDEFFPWDDATYEYSIILNADQTGWTHEDREAHQEEVDEFLLKLEHVFTQRSPNGEPNTLLYPWVPRWARDLSREDRIIAQRRSDDQKRAREADEERVRVRQREIVVLFDADRASSSDPDSSDDEAEFYRSDWPHNIHFLQPRQGASLRNLQKWQRRVARHKRRVRLHEMLNVPSEMELMHKRRESNRRVNK